MSHDHSSLEDGGAEHVRRRVARWRPAFRWATTLTTATMVVTGCTVATASLGWASTLALAATMSVVGVLAATCVACLRPVPTAVFVAAAVWTAAGGVAVWGLAVLSPSLGVVASVIGIVELTLMMRAGKPAPARTAAAKAQEQPSWDPPPAVLDAMAAELLDGLGISESEQLEVGEALSDAEVCRAWRISFVALERARRLGVVSAQARIAQFRSLLLDELERRQPRGFAAWLSSGPRAAGDPSRHLTS